MKPGRLAIMGVALVAIPALLVWLGGQPGASQNPATPSHNPAQSPPQSAASRREIPTFRLGLVPERNLFEQRKAYRAFADYLETHLRLPRGNSTLNEVTPIHVELVTSSSYAGVLKDFEERQIDAAFLGSLTAVLAADRYGAQVVIKSQTVQGADTYTGVIFVPADSAIKVPEDLRGKRLGGVATTSAGALYPIYLLAGISDAPRVTWSGTHDDVIAEVLAGRLDAGAVKDLRLDAYERAHPAVRIRRIAMSGRMPENSLVMRRDILPEVREAVVKALLAMDRDNDATPVLEELQLKRFEACDIREFKEIYDMIDALGPHWADLGVDGPAPKRKGG